MRGIVCFPGEPNGVNSINSEYYESSSGFRRGLENLGKCGKLFRSFAVREQGQGNFICWWNFVKPGQIEVCLEKPGWKSRDCLFSTFFVFQISGTFVLTKTVECCKAFVCSKQLYKKRPPKNARHGLKNRQNFWRIHGILFWVKSGNPASFLAESGHNIFWKSYFGNFCQLKPM